MAGFPTVTRMFRQCYATLATSLGWRAVSTHPREESPFGRRVVGLLIDWIACVVIFRAFVAPFITLTPAWQSFGPLLVLLVEHTVLVGLAGFTLGHRVVGVRVLPVARPRLTLLQALVRAALLCLFVPPVIIGSDGRGLHDRAAGTTIRRV